MGYILYINVHRLFREQRYEKTEKKLMLLWGCDMNNEELKQKWRKYRNKSFDKVIKHYDNVIKKQHKKKKNDSYSVIKNERVSNKPGLYGNNIINDNNMNNNSNDKEVNIFGFGNLNKLKLSNIETKRKTSVKSNVRTPVMSFAKHTVTSLMDMKLLHRMNNMRLNNVFCDE